MAQYYKLHKNDYVYHPLEMIKIIDTCIEKLTSADNLYHDNEIKEGLCRLLHINAMLLYPEKTYYCSNLHNLLLDFNPHKKDQDFLTSNFYPFWYSVKVENGAITKRLSILIDMKVEVLHQYTEGAE